MSGFLIKIIISILVIYLAVGLLIFIKQRDLIYFPVASIKHNFAEEIFINGDVSINVTVLNKGNKKALIYFGGNAEIVDYSALEFSTLFTGYTIFLVKYRGYGSSTGQPEEKGIYSDALIIYDNIKSDFISVSIIGRSLGSGVATFLASKRKIKKLVLVTPFDSIQNVAQEKFPIYPMSILLKDKYNSLARVNSITAETLIIAAENDHIIGRNHTDRLVTGFPSSQLTFEVIQGKGHNTISDSKKYYRLLSDFL
ncbi:MAG: alpha/beta hydrolase [Thiohalomonadales bacterium]